MRRLSFWKRPKVLWTVITSIIVLTVIILFVRTLNSPAEGTITQNNFDNQSEINTNRPKHYTDKYISFSYPGIYEIAPIQKSPDTVDAINLITSSHRDTYVAISVIRESIDTDSGVMYRRLHPDIYKVVSQTPTSLIFAKDDSKEYTGFIQHADKVIAISFTSVASQDMSADYKTISDSLAWRQ